ncbi:hypothetical protein RI056_03075 [Komagataeibacter nataicola]|nr:hypothetical protein [Komagataeibacter nataicola]WNM09056.1 hypothetical protein RI056_03075 [Komagataeibacter nataicola]
MDDEWQAERDWPLLTTGLAGRLRRDCMAQWLDFVRHPFVRGVADGTLPPEAFRNFLIQDYLHSSSMPAPARWRCTRLIRLLTCAMPQA